MSKRLMYEAYKSAAKAYECERCILGIKLDDLVYALSVLSDSELREVIRTGVLPHKSDLDTR